MTVGPSGRASGAAAGAAADPISARRAAIAVAALMIYFVDCAFD